MVFQFRTIHLTNVITPFPIDHPELNIPLHSLHLGTNILILDTHTTTQHELDICSYLHLTCDAE